MLQQFLKDYFSFTKKERKGIIYIIIIILILILLPFFFPYFAKDNPLDTSEFEKEITQLQKAPASKKYNENEYYGDYTPRSKNHEQVKNIKLFYFDPNTASANDWIRLGVREKTANTIQNYISKGGKFYKPEDIKKIWGLSKSDAERLIPYISIKREERTYPQYEQKNPVEKVNYTSRYPIAKVDINTADTTQYIALPGIGSRLANRIISFREKLGGFYSIDQIGETYLLPDSTFQKIKPHLLLNSTTVKKININSSSVDEMKSHPYIRYNMANAIFQYRRQHGNFNSVEGIKKIMTVTDDFYEKVSPYLTAN
ncbi:MAG: helix-hairpin-helix domain-containing protein [Ginsengibacter sp.]